MTCSITSVAVFCGSNFGNSDAYADGARQLGEELARAGITLIYGGTTKGLMGVVADSLMKAGGAAHGVITESLHARGHAHPHLNRSEIVATLRGRKERMAELADAFIAMPGGIGTMEEMMEVWTMNQLGEIDKPVGLLNIKDFYAPFLGFIDHMVVSKFLPPAHRHSISVDPDPAALIERLRSFQKTDVPKWL
ncbi:TIGR00730 family Rossman fold protein [Tardiphaga sp. 42S5]|uniref:LOG family protein n=1 Tax=Tardiphaga sp. 42S5 TaxID=1404799 RepID=UPI002A5A6B58|nr:TIGR00730 family Rossman fold protein [Tardiphaga sp. 42S5]WPO43751.1 TIGR00730 family Rossman fold protein [Tardiphaga sp. 42S5]